MPKHESGPVPRSYPTFAAAGTLLAALALVLGSSGTASAATATAPPQVLQQAKPVPGQAFMGLGIRMHDGGLGPATTDPVSTLSTSVQGVDVSSHQGNVNWTKLAASGVKWAYTKATEGTSYTNDYFAQQYNGPYKAGMTRGAYHFAIPNKSSGATQASYFVKHGGGWSADGRTLPGVLDIEYNPYGSTCYGKSNGSMVDWIKSFNSRYHTLTGRYPVIYTTTKWWKTCTGNSRAFGNVNPLWIAHFGSSSGTLPAGWGFYTMWQYTSSGPTVGDHDRFNGSSSRLKALAKG